MIRVAHILDTPGPGGAENVLIALAQGLDPNVFESVTCIRENSWMHRQLGNGQNPFLFLRDMRTLDLRFLRELINFLKFQAVDIVHSHEFFMNVYGTLAGALAGKPAISTVHGQADYAAEKMRRRIAYRWVAHASCLVTVSNQLGARFSEEVGVPHEKIRTVYNGILLQKFEDQCNLAGLRDELGISDAVPVVGMVGNLYPVKGYQYFIRAMKIVRKSFPDAVFVICGRGGLQGELENLSAECGLQRHVKFLGFRNDIAALLNLMDIFVLSSLSEGLSLSILEAMAAGKPTVVTDVGGNREIVIEGETGFLVPPKDAEKLAEKVCLLLNNRPLAESFGEKGQDRVSTVFSQERMIRDYQDLYREVIDKKKR